MTLRLTTSLEGSRPLIQVDGRLDGDGPGELEALCQAMTGCIRLDLRNLLDADSAGIALLRRLRNSGAELLNARPFLKLMIEEGA